MKMKKSLSMVAAVLLFIMGSVAAQTVDNGKQVSDKIANKVKDSLGLTTALRNKIYDINDKLSTSKMQMWNLYTDTLQLRLQLQRIENTRDSLYKAVLPADKYQAYMKKKSTVVGVD